jgi:N6-L-threonylcarbamoyladenine synthase
MYILAFETSCDDTSVAILKDRELISMSTRTQLEHDATGGVVPEVAARSHANAIFPCIADALSGAGITLDQIDIIACTRSPGLAPSLLTGIVVAETLSLSLANPLIWIDHIEAHMFANFLERETSDIAFPNLTLTVSGGHTEIYLWKSLYEFELIAQTRDDAAGECFDKVAKMMGLGFPGGAKIARLSTEFASIASSEQKFTAEHLFPRGLSGD